MCNQIDQGKPKTPTSHHPFSYNRCCGDAFDNHQSSDSITHRCPIPHLQCSSLPCPVDSSFSYILEALTNENNPTWCKFRPGFWSYCLNMEPSGFCDCMCRLALLSNASANHGSCFVPARLLFASKSSRSLNSPFCPQPLISYLPTTLPLQKAAENTRLSS